MAKKQSRRSVSMNREVYDLALVHAKSIDRPLAQLVEDLLIAAMDEAGVMMLDPIVKNLVTLRIASRAATTARAKVQAKPRSAAKGRRNLRAAA